MTRTQPPTPARRWAVPVVLGCSALIAFAPLRPGPAAAATSPVSAVATTDPGVATTDPGASTSVAPADPASAPSSTPSSTTTPTVPPTSVPAGTGTPTTDPGTSATGTASSDPGSAALPVPTLPASVTVPGTVSVDHVVLALIAGPGQEPKYIPADDGLGNLDRGQTVRVRFQIRNTGTVAVTLIPQLDYRLEPAPAQSGDPFTVVPVEPQPELPLYIDREWEVIGGGSGSRLGPTDEVISTAGLLLAAGPGETPVAGRHSLAENPDLGIVLPPSGVTEEEFSVRVSEDAPAVTGYQFRLSDAGSALSGNGIATVRTGEVTVGTLSPGQRNGSPVGAPTALAPAGAPTASAPVGAPTASAPAGKAAAAVTASASVAGGPVHGPYQLDSDQCGACHRAHTGQNGNLLVRPGPQSNLCFTCHDGTGAPQNVKSGYANPSLPANDPATGAYYSHDALTASNHTSSSVEEFAGVQNRHSECGDCHNAHQAKGSATTQTAQGWTASGRLTGISGVGVTNGAAGTFPAYTFLDGTALPVTLEYQLCFKCHSGYTVLRSETGLPPSRQPLDKGVEFNPANASFHPVEAPGTNQTANMAGSLSGTSPYKLWNFTTAGTVRCAHCHAAAISGTAPTADADLSPHASTNRAILVRPYRDQVLKASGEAYTAADFALCYTCHAESPFAGAGTGASSFRYHRKHVSGISGEGSGGPDIDTAGAGRGNALCAECHYRIHGSSSSYGPQALSGTRLVNFAPDVTANNGVLSWTSTGAGGSCTLTCHGKRHTNYRY
jgi:predicted CXXCH cytochrome family protein